MNNVSVIMDKTMAGWEINYMGFRPSNFNLKTRFNGNNFVFVGEDIRDYDLKRLLEFVEMCPIGHCVQICNNHRQIW